VVASMLFENHEWVTGRHPEVVDWLRRMHGQGADLASACAGALLLAETGLLDGLEATTHWAFAATFRRNFPNVRLRVEELLIVGGRNNELVMSGAASSWQDLILFLISRHASPDAAQEIGKFLLYQWNTRSQAPFIPFAPAFDHGDALIREVQRSLEEDPSTADSVEEMAERCGLPYSSFRRRFRRATGYSPLQYLQHLRIEEAKRLLEQTSRSVDDICWAVGYEQPASFRRLFKRLTSLAPSEYRRKFRAPWLAERGESHRVLPAPGRR
jgi:transcriptional regulator GlxA family with amidase domain